MESILTSVKKMLGIDEAYTHFDVDLIMHINSTFMILHQMGVGPKSYFSINGSDETWDDFIPEGQNIEGVKTYMYQKVRYIFDPPQSSAHMEALSNSIAELEWRLHVASESV